MTPILPCNGGVRITPQPPYSTPAEHLQHLRRLDTFHRRTDPQREATKAALRAELNRK